ncbi:hypothetical protein BGZ54_003582 [Gamsiella multidivaricata]|nr:hypothetical protein BGZ54_003582 [Gamsiella multidivaricata]
MVPAIDSSASTLENFVDHCSFTICGIQEYDLEEDVPMSDASVPVGIEEERDLMMDRMP